MTHSTSTISHSTSSNTLTQLDETAESSMTEKIWGIYNKYIVQNKYLNEIFHYFFVGIGFTLGAVLVLWAAKDIIIEIFRRCMRS